MRKIEGFETARKELSRLTPADSYPVSATLKQSLERLFGTADPEQAVRLIIDEVRRKGDAAIFELTAKIDGIGLTALEIPRDELSKASKEQLER